MDGTTAEGGIAEPATNGDKHEEQQFDPSRKIWCRVPAGGAEELAAWSERLLAAAFLSSVLGAPVEAGAGSAVLGAVAAPRSCGVLFPELVVVMAAPSLVWGLRWPSPRCLAVLLLKIFRSLLVGCCSSSVDAVGFAEDGGRLRSCLRRETATARWRRLDADFLSSLRFCCLRQMDLAALQQVIGIIKRKALIKELAAAYHAECVACCKELLQLQRKWEEEQYVEAKMPEEPKPSSAKSSKRRRR